ncbi:hypothetical protein [Psychroflexus aestuariivivens]|uniref:hypothetical protein n=1 Tax=Psychroflexus aestuariivivens TaxID=1795040 RepID=UPI000FDA3E6B|nr:hypothetical protein [Psychroflexus aestuariivivens]
MNKSILVFLIAIFSFNKSNSQQIEPNATKILLDFYKGECLLIKNVESNCYEIELSKSELLNYDVNSINYHAGNIAYILHENLKVKDYNCVKVKINLNNGDSFDFIYSDKELAEVESYIPYFEEVTGLIKNKDYKKLFYQFDKSFVIDKQSIEKMFSNVENKLGKLNHIYCTGFKNFKKKECGKVIEFKAVLVHEKMAVNMFLSFRKENKKLVLLLIP